MEARARCANPITLKANEKQRPGSSNRGTKTSSCPPHWSRVFRRHFLLRRRFLLKAKLKAKRVKALGSASPMRELALSAIDIGKAKGRCWPSFDVRPPNIPKKREIFFRVLSMTSNSQFPGFLSSPISNFPWIILFYCDSKISKFFNLFLTN